MSPCRREPNKALEPTANSVRCAPTVGGGSPRAFGKVEAFMVKFQFRIGRAFLDYHWHPITIPKAHYPCLEQEELAQDSVSIESPFGSMPGSIVYSKAGYGPYYQIRMDGGSTRDPMSEFKFGQYITVELDRVGKIVRVTLRTA